MLCVVRLRSSCQKTVQAASGLVHMSDDFAKGTLANEYFSSIVPRDHLISTWFLMMHWRNMQMLGVSLENLSDM